MSVVLDACLEDLSHRIDEQQEADFRSAWIDFLEDRYPGEYWLPPARSPAPPQVDWPKILVNQALADPEAMLLQQFGLCSEMLAEGGNTCLNVRCNYGTVIIPLLFGCELFLMEEKLDTLPANHPLPSLDAVRAAVDAGVPDLNQGYGAQVFETAQRFLQVLEKYPVLQRNIALYHPDVQGPIDNAETTWGSTLFYAFHDEPDLVHDFLNLQTETYAAFMRRWYALLPPAPQYSNHWGLMHKGVITLRNDSLMNLSPQAYVDFVRPLDQRLFDEFGGGIIHYCGRGDHFIPAMCQMTGLTAITLSQPHMNDMDVIYRHTVDQKIKLLLLDHTAAENANRPLHGQVHCY